MADGLSLLFGVEDFGEETARLLVDWESGESGKVVLEVEDLKETGEKRNFAFSSLGWGQATCGSYGRRGAGRFAWTASLSRRYLMALSRWRACCASRADKSVEDVLKVWVWEITDTG